jgi:hypothetical protein
MNEQRLPAFWCQSSSPVNFGDALTPWLIHGLTGRLPHYGAADSPHHKGGGLDQRRDIGAQGVERWRSQRGTRLTPEPGGDPVRGHIGQDDARDGEPCSRSAVTNSMRQSGRAGGTQMAATTPGSATAASPSRDSTSRTAGCDSIVTSPP